MYDRPFSLLEEGDKTYNKHAAHETIKVIHHFGKHLY